LRLIDEGADLLDIGGESTRPGAADVSEAEELERVLPLLEALRATGVPISVDTSKPGVMRQCWSGRGDQRRTALRERRNSGRRRQRCGIVRCMQGTHARARPVAT
jgi:hypothetical protein